MPRERVAVLSTKRTLVSNRLNCKADRTEHETFAANLPRFRFESAPDIPNNLLIATTSFQQVGLLFSNFSVFLA